MRLRLIKSFYISHLLWEILFWDENNLEFATDIVLDLGSTALPHHKMLFVAMSLTCARECVRWYDFIVSWATGNLGSVFTFPKIPLSQARGNNGAGELKVSPSVTNSKSSHLRCLMNLSVWHLMSYFQNWLGAASTHYNRLSGEQGLNSPVHNPPYRRHVAERLQRTSAFRSPKKNNGLTFPRYTEKVFCSEPVLMVLQLFLGSGYWTEPKGIILWC